LLSIVARDFAERTTRLHQTSNMVQLEPAMTADLIIDTQQGEIIVDGNPVNLLPTERRILSLLANASGCVLSRREILDGLHGEKYAITDRAVDVQIAGLRRKLGSARACIETVRGVGFRFVP